MQENNFCVMPYAHLNIKNEGRVTSCWRQIENLGNFHEQSLHDIWFGGGFSNLRKRLANGDRPNGCKSCWDLEDSGVTSLRQKMNEEITIEGRSKYPTTMEIRFENVCNFECRHCNPKFSSKWENRYLRDERVKQLSQKLGTPMDIEQHTKLPDRIIKEIKEDFLPHLRKIYITGGEPFLHPQHYEMLRYAVETGYAHNIELLYNSNMSTLSYRNESLLDLWQHFKHITLTASLDGDRSMMQYLRIGSDPDVIESNIKLVHDTLPKKVWPIGVITASIYNITRMPAIFDYFTQLGLFANTSVVQFPAAINVKVLPKGLKVEITDQWEEYKSNLEVTSPYFEEKYCRMQERRIKSSGDKIINYMNSENRYEQDWQATLKYIHTLDSVHGTDFISTYPEFDTYWGTNAL